MLNSTTRRTTAPPAALIVLFSAVVAAPLATPGLAGLSARPTPHPVTASTQNHALRVVSQAELAGAEGAANAPAPSPSVGTRAAQGELARARGGALSNPAPIDTPVAVAGVTWPAGELKADDTVQVRVMRKGAWGDWEELHTESEHGPDPRTAEAKASSARQGSDPYVVVGEQVQARVLSADSVVPTGVSLAVVDPGSSDADATVGTSVPGGAAAAAARPTIYTRAQWGADESLRVGSPGYSQAHIAYVHHTAGSNAYSTSQVPGIIRGIYAYHVKSNGWSDIGYNFLVDRFGRTWEGRYGGVDRAVVGAHTAGHNSWSFGVSAIGNFDATAVPSAVTTALTNLIAWKMTVHGMPATGTVYAKERYYNRISGHRDAYGTECPGGQLYAKLPSIRSAVAARMGSLPVTRVARDVDRAGQTDLLSYPAPASGSPIPGAVTTLRSAVRDPLRWPTTLGGNWNTVRLATLTPDVTGDGLPDLIAQYPQGNNLRVYRGNGTGGVSGLVSSGSGWSAMKALIAAGDQNGDGRNDLMAIGSSGQLAFYPGTNQGTFGPGTVVGTGWSGYSSVSAAGDLTGDGRTDLLAVRTSDGALVVAAGTGGGRVGTPTTKAGGWGALSPVVAAGDLDRDGNRDVLARESGGALRAYYGDAAHTPARWNRWGRGWGAMAQLTSGQDFTGDGVADLLAVATQVDNGTLRVYGGTGERDFTRGSSVPGTTGADVVQLVGDVNGDGYVDAVMRKGDALQALPGRSGGGFGAAVTVGAAGWAVMPKIAAAADQDYDGVPDLLVTARDGRLLRYGFRRDFTLKPAEELDQAWGTYKSFTGTGAFNRDANGDVVALVGDGSLVLFRGSGPGALYNDYRSGTLPGVVLSSRQTDLTQILGVGDYNGDGGADIVAAGSGGRLWLYAGRGDGTLWPGRQPMTGGLGTGQYLG